MQYICQVREKPTRANALKFAPSKPTLLKSCLERRDCSIPSHTVWLSLLTLQLIPFVGIKTKMLWLQKPSATCITHWLQFVLQAFVSDGDFLQVYPTSVRAPPLLSVLSKTNVEQAYSFLLCSEWILWGNHSINCDTATLHFKFFHTEITASGTHRPTYYSQTTHWEEMHWPQVCYITINVTPPRIWIVHLDEVSEVIKSSLHNKPQTWADSGLKV